MTAFTIQPLDTAATRAVFNPRNPAGSRVAAVVSAGAHGTAADLADTLTGYGRREGYDSLANARRAAYMLTRGTERSAAGIFQQGNRFYVRAVGEVTHHDGALLALHMEGAAKAVQLLKVLDPRLLMLVDGSTKVFSSSAPA